jgi:hypothetical protein
VGAWWSLHPLHLGLFLLHISHKLLLPLEKLYLNGQSYLTIFMMKCWLLNFKNFNYIFTIFHTEIISVLTFLWKSIQICEPNAQIGTEIMVKHMAKVLTDCWQFNFTWKSIICNTLLITLKRKPLINWWSLVWQIDVLSWRQWGKSFH